MNLRQHMTANQQNLRMDLTYARQEAATRGVPVSACPSSDGATCTGATDWAVGRIVFADANGNGAVDAGDTIVRASTAFGGDVTATSTRSNAIFDGTGAHPSGPFAINLCRTGLTQANVRVRRVGHASVETTATVCT
jgi:type IV fimbrial biogenesis protein FimT